MIGPLIRDVPYRTDSSRFFERLVDAPWPVFLDSGRPWSHQGRFDILTAAPSATLVTRGLETEIRCADRVWLSRDDPLALLSELLGPRRRRIAGLPFGGGAIGYFAYDLARRLERIPALAVDAEGTPDMAVGIYDWALLVDHRRQRSWLMGWDVNQAERWHRRMSDALGAEHLPARVEPLRVLGPVTSSLADTDYQGAFARVQHYLRQGDAYQVNIARRFCAPAQGDAWSAYQQLRRSNPAPFGAYLANPMCQILCSSPERFLRVRGDRVETKPIKGTRPRGSTPGEDRQLAESLRHSAKDRAENVMIVDLLRNDLGKVCRVGSVQVPRLFEVETFQHVHHLVSTVRGRLAPEYTAVDLLRACFPGGSITGAPKLRAMEIIEELEPLRRGIYCGAIGYLGYDGAMDTNIAIRTLVQANGVLRLWAGGGIVVDSDAQAEYREIDDKAAPMLELLELLRAPARSARLGS